MAGASDPAGYTLAELCIAAAAEAWRHDGEVLATGIGLVPRLAAGLAMLTFNPDLLMTDGEAYLVSEPVPVGPRRGYQPRVEGWMPYRRVFETLWQGRRHAMLGPTQIDRTGAANISCIGDHRRPRTQLLGVRGFPGNSIHHPNSFFVPNHSPRVFVEKVDMASSVGADPARLPRGVRGDFVDLRLVVTNLAVLDFQGPGRQLRLVSVHPGVEARQVQEQTGFELARAEPLRTTPPPSPEQLRLIREVLDPSDLRAGVFAASA
jgi:glutaconate CoA-transferase subunit B